MGWKANTPVDTAPQGDTARMFLTIPQAAELLNISPRTVERLVAAGDIPVHRFGRSSVRIKRANLDAYTDAAEDRSEDW